MLAKLEPRHRAKLADLLAATPEFTRPDVDVALELIDCGLAEPTSDDYRFLIREEAEEILGYACFGATPMTEGCFDLYWLVVERKARRAGVARELMAAVERQLAGEGARIIRVETAGIESYAAARGFYQRIGYGEAARLRDFYWPGNDLHIFTKYLG